MNTFIVNIKPITQKHDLKHTLDYLWLFIWWLIKTIHITTADFSYAFDKNIDNAGIMPHVKVKMTTCFIEFVK